MKHRRLFACLLLVIAAFFCTTLVLAAEEAARSPETAAIEAEADTVSWKAISAGIAIGIAATGAAVAMGHATSRAVEGIARQPEAEGKIRTSLMLGLVFIETAVIYALLAGILIIFVL